jgi:hypothetical protein
MKRSNRKDDTECSELPWTPKREMSPLNWFVAVLPLRPECTSWSKWLATMICRRQHGRGFERLEQEPDLYTDADLLPRSD